MRNFFFLFIFIGLYEISFAQDTILLITGRQIIVSSVDLHDNTIAYRKGDKLKTIDPDRVFSIIYKDGSERIIYQSDSLDPLDFHVDSMRSFIHGEQDAKALYRNNVVKIAGLGVGAVSGLGAIYGLVGPPLFSTVVGSFSPNVQKQLTLKISGDAASALGISDGKYLNEVTGSVLSPKIKKGQVLKVNHSAVLFEEDVDLDKAVDLINSRFHSTRFHAVNQNDRMRLYKIKETSMISRNSYREGFEKKVRDYKIRNAMIAGLIGFVSSSIVYSIVLK